MQRAGCLSLGANFDATSVAQQLVPELCWAVLAAAGWVQSRRRQRPSSSHGKSKAGGTRQACAQREVPLRTSLRISFRALRSLLAR